MFLNKKDEYNDNNEAWGAPEKPKGFFSMKNFIFWSVFLILTLLIFAIIYFLVILPASIDVPSLDWPSNKHGATSTRGYLPVDENGLSTNGYGNGSSTDEVRAEFITFGQFYKYNTDDFKASLESYNLPINIKIDVSNYYNISRKINLDPYIDEFNQNGFVVMDNQFRGTADDYFEMHRLLVDKEIPVVVTTDFLFYYYQNILKGVFKEIEQNAFYDNLWQINKDLFDISLTRYKKRLAEVGLANDLVLEGARLELAFFAVALKLLMPRPEQINTQPNFIDDTKFNEREADGLNFDMPSYLEDDVEREIDFIRFGNRETKSPVLLYGVNYEKFKVPVEYKNNAKLNNFYLATRWLNSVFPLYYKSEECAECLLDYNDWTINFIAANFITRDLFDNQDIKNQWAIIYKFISHFTGLRSDLTYLQNHEVLIDLFGKDYRIEDIFGMKNEEREINMEKIRNRLSEYTFSALEGSYDRGNDELKSVLGMRLLQEPYWPNDFIYEKLTGFDLQSTYPSRRDDRITVCRNKEVGNYRCHGIGLDIIKIMDAFPLTDNYFYENSLYENYSARINELSNEIDSFDIFTWNNNVYWSTLDIARSLYNYENTEVPIFMRGEEWQREKVINSMLGAWINLHLPEDILINYFEKQGSSLTMQFQCNELNYIEPNKEFIEILIAKNSMLIKMLQILKVTEKTNAVAIELKETNKRLTSLLGIVKKELTGEVINNEDCKFIHEFMRHFLVDESRTKSFDLEFGLNKNINESISGLKLMAIVYQRGDKKVMAIGPVFNYQEN
ncbi:DUF3160 domain-containing protein [bacterium]|nr:DUF3160 domain-containing protein [bacterium]